MQKSLNKFTYLKEVKSTEDGKGVYYFIASTEDVDRDRDVMIVNGIDTTNYEKSPVILFAHNGRDFPVGKAVDIRKEDGKLLVGIEFADTEEGQKVKYLVDNGYMKAVSIGFIAKEVYSKDGWFGEKFDVLKEKMPEWYEKNKEKLLIADRVIAKSELLEISVVPVPANQNALLVMRSKGIDNIYSLSCDEKGKTILVDIPMEEDVIEVKNAVAYSAHPKNMKKDETSAWDKNKAIESLRKWASSDGSGDKDKISWVKYRKGFGWYDANVIDNFTSYKLPHHWVENGDFYVVWRGVVAAMAALLGARGGVGIPAEDKKSVYNHLAKHYKNDFDKEPPEYKEAGYTLKEAMELFDDDLKEEFIKLYEPKELIKEISDILGETMELKETLERLQKEYEELEKSLKSVEEKLNSLLENKEVEKEDIKDNSNEDEKSASPSEKEVDSDADEVVKVRVSEEDLKKTISELFEKLLNGGK
jgi:phage head maturation protease